MRMENKHHITVEQVATDFERIEVIGADALLAARNAWASIDDLPTEIAVELHREIADLRQIVNANAMLKEVSRHLIGSLLRQLEDRRERVDPSARYPLFEHLHNAVRLSQRVADLVNAERHIGKSRGF